MRWYQKISLIFAFLIAVFIFYISSLQFPPQPFPGFSYTSVIYHFGIFFIFSLFLFLAGRFEKKFIFLILIISFLYAALDELHQFFIPGRVADFFDLGIDMAGSVLSFGIFSFLSLLKFKFVVKKRSYK